MHLMSFVTSFAPSSSLRLVACLVLAVVSFVAFDAHAALGSHGARIDRAAMEAIDRRADEFRSLVVHAEVDPVWIDDDRFWYGNQSSGRFVFVDAARGVREPLFDAARVAAFAGIDESRLAASIDGVRVVPALRGVVVVRLRDRPGTIRIDRASGDIAPGGPDDDRVFGAPLGQEPIRSRNGGRSVHLLFENRSSESLRLVWVDGGGGHRPYGDLAPGASHRQHTFVGHAWRIETTDGRLVGYTSARQGGQSVTIEASHLPGAQESDAEARPIAAETSPRFTVERDGPNLRFRDATNGSIVLATTDGGGREPSVWDGAERPVAYDDDPIWSPDGTRAVLRRRVVADQRIVHIVESAPRDQLQPRLRSFPYTKPGDAIDDVDLVVAHLVGDADGPPRLVRSQQKTSLWQRPWSIDRIAWDADGRTVRFLFNERGHQVLRWIALDTTTGVARAVIEERSPTFIDYAGKFFLHDLPATNEAIWMSERDGWNHLWLIDRTTGAVKRPLTSGPWAVRSVARVDERDRSMIVGVGGLRTGESPYHVHWCRVPLDGGSPILLTEGDGTHEITFSPSGRWLINHWSRVDLPETVELRDAATGARSLVLEQASIDRLLERGWRPPERFVAKGRDGVTDIHGVIVRPIDFDPSLKYPVLESIYAGPHGSFVPVSFDAWHGLHSMAEHGFIVVQIDGMGTNHRSKAFHDVAWKNLADAGFPDRVLWLRALAMHEPAVDLDRVGIWGGSAGGQSAVRALIDHGDLYKAAVADCGCHDNRMDKIWWNELWMGWPVDAAYEQSSNAVHAAKLRGALLLIVGELDTNVDPASTMQVVRALVDADKDFELLVLPGLGHGAAESSYGQRRRADFFRRTLGTPEPR
jgi:dipeptidyl aminopeptidase/acylaminoacyl peptidase